jgi:L-fuconolactonase
LERYAANPWLKGVRHVVQDETDDRFILGEEFNRGISLLKDFDLVYDILIYERQLSASIEFVDQHPELIFVLDHIAKPKIIDEIFEPWATQMKDLSKRSNVYCKLSGMATEADWENWSVEDLHPYMEIALECFGPGRIMFGSDWPVARLAIEYAQWVEICRTFISKLSTDEQKNIEGGTAIKVYKL